MTLFVQICGAVFLAVVLVLALKSTSKEFAAVLAMVVCCLTTVAALNYLKPVLQFLQSLENLGNLDNTMVEILLKSTGIGIITDIAMLVCKDAGNESMGKAVQILGSAVILYLSVPLFTALIELLQKILGGI